jgi:hypothetical protein
VKDYAKIAAVFFRLLKKETKWVWSEECVLAFELLKQKLTEYPILRQPNLEIEFIVYCDASNFALGAILAQKDSMGEYVCSYASRLLKGAEIHYAITHKECLAVVWGIKQFRIYLYGKKFTVVTDHVALSWLMNIVDPSARLARWAIYLQAYDFVIVHRKGANHGNVDALSRPVLASRTVQIYEILSEDASSKNLDPWDDTPLMHFLEFGKFPAGLSKKQMKRVMNKKDRFKLEDKVLLFRKSQKSDWRIWPANDEKTRRDLIESAHAFGHFKAAATYQRLAEKYFWRKIVDDVIRVVAECLVCQRHQKVAPLNHKAMALQVDGVFDLLVLDYVFGFPMTDRGNIGLLNAMIYSIDFPFSWPIKSKEARETVTCLWEYIALCGPPKAILTDQGKEFNNKLVDELLKWTGVDRKVTSAYSPRTNGKAERFNQTMTEALRKLAECDPSNWDLHVPFLLLSYRSKVHTRTGFTPFRLLFGTEMNTFESWSTTSLSNESAELIKRVDELEILAKDTRQRALINLEDSQEDQKIVQDNRETIQEERLPVGTVVFIKNEGILGKLDPRYRGPYKVARANNSGNYELLDFENKLLDYSFPLRKLKIVKNPETMTEVSWEVEKIVDSRVVNNKTEYLVKWVGYPDSENSWTKESNFDSVIPIQEFLRAKSELNLPAVTDGAPKRKRGRPRKKSVKATNSVLVTVQEPSGHSLRPRLNMANTLGILLALFCLFLGVPAQVIRGDFRFCDNTSPMTTILDFKGSCFNSDLDKANCNSAYYGKQRYALLVEQKDVIYGKGTQCRKITKEYTYTKTFWGEQMTSTSEYHVILRREDCLNMRATQQCGDRKMSCDGENCILDFVPKPDFRWWSTVTKVGEHCSLTNRVIHGKDRTSKLFKSIDGDCRAQDLECVMSDSIIIWDKNVIHECPYEWAGTFETRCVINGDTLIGNDVSGKGEEEGSPLLLKLTGEWFTECNLRMRRTEENFVVVSLNSSLNLTALHKLAVAKDTPHLSEIYLETEGDARYADSVLRMYELNQKMCSILLSMLSAKKSTEYDEFFSIYDLKGNEAILLLRDGTIFIPTCSVVTELKLENLTNCYADIPAQFTVDNVTVDGFIEHGNILVRRSRQVSCSQSKLVRMILGDLSITMRGNVVTVAKLVNVKYERLVATNFNISQLNFKHSNHITEGTNIYKLIHDVTSVEEPEGFRIVDKDVPEESQIEHLQGGFAFLMAIWNNIKFVFWLSLGALVCSALVFLCI